jgi:hypothetical protein
VAARGKGVEVDLELQVDPDTNLALTSEEACRVVENLLTNRLSVEMARPPRLNLRYSELRLAGAPTEALPSAPPPPAQESPAETEVKEPPAAAAETSPAAEEGKPSAEETSAEAEGEGQQAQKET